MTVKEIVEALNALIETESEALSLLQYDTLLSAIEVLCVLEEL
jgi:hypothetical protein